MVRLDDGIEVGVQAQGAKGGRGLVFRPVHVQTGLEVLREATAADGAAPAGVVLDRVGLAECLAGQLLDREHALGEVLRRDVAEHHPHVHVHEGAVLAKGHGDHVSVDVRQGLLRQRSNLCCIRRAGLRIADGSHSLQVLRPHERAHAAAPGAAPLVVHDGGVSDLLLAARGDAGHADVGVAQLVLDELLRLVAVLAPEMGGVPDLGLAVLQVEVDRLVRTAGDDDPVEARALEAEGEVPAAGGLTPEPRQRRDPASHVSAHHGNGRAGERPGGENQGVLWAQRILVLGQAVVDQGSRQGGPADVLLQILLGKRKILGRSGPEVYIEKPAMISVHALILLQKSISLPS